MFTSCIGDANVEWNVDRELDNLQLGVAKASKGEKSRQRLTEKGALRGKISREIRASTQKSIKCNYKMMKAKLSLKAERELRRADLSVTWRAWLEIQMG